MTTGRSYLSIGEVLTTLKQEFPDVTVSKIRFLESEDLVHPQRTASSYRMFYEKDLERLRLILKMQRDSFLPLKVIRERLAALDAGTITTDQAVAAAPVTITPPPAPAAQPAAPNESEPADDIRIVSQPVHLTESDLAGTTGLDISQVQALREFGVICEHRMNGGTFFDGDDLAVGELARDFLKLGIEPRHLKQLRRFAEQEAEMYSTLVGPAMKNRRPEAREQATDTLNELTKLSKRLRATYLRQRLRSTINGDR
jgi:DNA-binding transcriptional MerR regulator